MPLGFTRLNERTTRPNAHINFIKPLPSSSSTQAEEYLSLIAAIMYPLMKSHHIYVQSLEEFPPNPEFAGRNFNAGEVIQLVIKDRAGGWLPLRHVQMVMVHELAHCREMNHSKYFWAVRNTYAEELRGLWAKGYMGEGLWGRGRKLQSGAFMGVGMPDWSLLPENLCGGTYRRRGRKRKREAKERPRASYAERQQRRILKKFGEGGVTLGADEETKMKLEAGKKVKGKPRVANSARGRELRAAAALARFEKAKEDVEKEEPEDSETESEYEWPPSDEDVPSDRLATDSSGHNFVRVCDDEDAQDEDVKREMQELLDADRSDTTKQTPQAAKKGIGTTKDELAPSRDVIKEEDISTESESEPESSKVSIPKKREEEKTISSLNGRAEWIEPSITTPEESLEDTILCPACSLSNDVDTVMCIACSNILQPDKMPNHWRCESVACQGSSYLNMGDFGRCQLCGAAKPAGKS